MTWAKLGSEFPDECANVGLSDAGHRTHTEAICWLFRVERTDCLVPKRILTRITYSERAPDAIAELLAVEWWADRGSCIEVLHHADVVRAGIVAQQKARARSKRSSAAYRQRRAEDDDASADVTGHVSDDADRQTDRQAAVTGRPTNELPRDQQRPERR